MSQQRPSFGAGATLVVALVLLPAALPAAPYLVKDLNTSPGLNFGYVNLYDRETGSGVTYFAAADPAHGTELWRSDGTPGGTERLTDICAGRCDSLPAAITVRAGRVFFKANDGFSGDELWVSDGTPGSERRVRDLCPGVCSTSPGRVAEAGDRLLFLSSFPDSGRYELWRTDGTREGTVRVKAVCTVDCFSLGDLAPIGERALFIVNGLDLWVTDGTAGGTRLLRRLGSPFNPVSLLPSDGIAWVWDSDSLWRTDGTAAGTFLLKRFDELSTRPDSPHFLFQRVLWHGLFFGVLYSGEMIRSDGTPEGTFRIASFPEDSPLAEIAALDSEVLFRVREFSGNSVLWSSRGTADTTGPKFALAAESPVGLTRISADRAVFVAGPGDFNKTQLWVTDGTEAGTRMLVLPGFVYSVELFATGDGRVFFFRYDLAARLWITDGTEAGTHEVQSFGNPPGSSGPKEQAALGGKLVFSATMSDGSSVPLFISDGTADGTGLLSGKPNDAFAFFRFGDQLLFSAFRPRRFYPEMWATDGTPDGTIRISRYSFSNPARLGGQILFSGSVGNAVFGTGIELLKTDGLPWSVDLVKDIDPFFFDENPASGERCVGESSFPVPGVVLGGRLLLAADDGRSGRELWVSDGTRAGTVPLRDINPRRAPGAPETCFTRVGPHRHDTGLSSNPQGFVVLGGVALFSAADGLRGRELWITNGTSPGTRRLADLVPGSRGSAPHDLVRFQDRAYFLAANPGPGQGESLWRTDGTARGTTRVLDLALEGLPSWGRSLTVAAGRLFFTVFNETTGAELWASTGEAEGTGMVTDLNTGSGSSSPQFLTAVGGALLYAADDGLTGLEPWRTDGTADGTVRVDDIAPGRDASSPGPFTALPSIVMTGADDGVHGREPWAIPKAEIVRPE